MDALRIAEKRVREAGGRLVVFGSLVEGGFHERSDLDLAIFGLPSGADSQAAVEIEAMLAAAGFDVDIALERFLCPSLHERVLNRGREPSALG
jgi:predicted nucleotidyltransferase